MTSGNTMVGKAMNMKGREGSEKTKAKARQKSTVDAIPTETSDVSEADSTAKSGRGWFSKLFGKKKEASNNTPDTRTTSDENQNTKDGSNNEVRQTGKFGHKGMQVEVARSDSDPDVAHMESLMEFADGGGGNRIRRDCQIGGSGVGTDTDGNDLRF